MSISFEDPKKHVAVDTFLEKIKCLEAEIGELKEKCRQLEALCNTDYLTDFPNRRSYEEEGIRFIKTVIWEWEHGEGSENSCLYIDLDNFKAVNDTLGHKIGDKLLQGLSVFLRNRTRRSDVLGRIGGDEFSVLLHRTNRDKAIAFAKRLSIEFAQINSDPLLQEKGIIISLSFGLCVFDGDFFVEKTLRRLREQFESEDTLTFLRNILHEADLCLQKSKEQGKNRLCWRDWEFSEKKNEWKWEVMTAGNLSSGE